MRKTHFLVGVLLSSLFAVPAFAAKDQNSQKKGWEKSAEQRSEMGQQHEKATEHRMQNMKADEADGDKKKLKKEKKHKKEKKEKKEKKVRKNIKDKKNNQNGKEMKEQDKGTDDRANDIKKDDAVKQEKEVAPAASPQE